jgi:hypothetical protein
MTVKVLKIEETLHCIQLKKKLRFNTYFLSGNALFHSFFLSRLLFIDRGIKAKRILVIYSIF